MAITNTTSATSTNLIDAPAGTNPNGILAKDDFLKLLLVELQYQDPTEPMDSEKILSQTSQLATLESAENTNKTLEALSASLLTSSQFNTVSAIGKIADTGSNGMLYEQGQTANFEVYFSDDIVAGNIEVKDSTGNVIKTIPVTPNQAGVYSFDWNGVTDAGNGADSGVYYIEASYANTAGETIRTRAGTYPIESVRFEDGKSLLKLGSSYVPFDSIVEIYQ